jgi:ABC-2 type transport system permease protein
MSGPSSVWVFARLELAESLRSKWAAFAATLYLGMVAAFVWLGLRESSMLGFTGLTRVLLNVANAVIVVFPLVVLVGTHSAIVRAKTSGFFELMLTQPVRRTQWFWGLLLARVAVLIGPLVGVMVGAALFSLLLEPEPGLAAVAARSLAITVSLVFSFIGVGLWVSSRARTLERAMVWALVAWVATAALHDVLLIAVLLRTPLPPEVVFFVSALNPSEAARVGILSSVDPELSALGPVGFWLSNTLGPTLALVIAVGWPALLGVLTTWRAARNLERADLVS